MTTPVLLCAYGDADAGGVITPCIAPAAVFVLLGNAHVPCCPQHIPAGPSVESVADL